MRKFLYSLSVFGIMSLCVIDTHGQKIVIEGFIVDEENNPIEYVNALLLYAKDSTIMQGGVMVDGKLLLENSFPNSYILQLSSLGFVTQYISCNMAHIQHLNLDTIVLKRTMLDEVEIISKRPVINRENGNLIVNVKNTSLQDAGNAIDVLRKSPNVIVDYQNNITVFGKGVPLVLIDGKEVQTRNELEALRSDDILSIEIDRNPSAEYHAEKQSVIKITTRKHTRDIFRLLVFNNSYFRRYYKNTVGISINSKIKKCINNLSYIYDYSHHNNLVDAYEHNYLHDDTINSTTSGEDIYKRNSHILFYGLSYQANRKNTIGFQFMSSMKNNHDRSVEHQKIEFRKKTLHNKILQTSQDKDHFFNINANYKLEIDSVTYFSTIIDYAQKNLKKDTDISEQSVSDNNLFTLYFHNIYNIVSNKVDFYKMLPSQWEIKMGVQYALTKIDNENRQNTLVKLPVNNKISDHILAAFFSSEKKITKKLKWNMGLRYENSTYSIEEDKTIKRTEDNFFPNAKISYNYSDDYNFSLSYSKKISRPRFKEINPHLHRYFNAYAYSIGNPSIKSTIYHNVELGATLFKNFFISFDYVKKNNTRVMVGVNDENNPKVVKYTYVNIPNAHSFSSSLIYNYSKKVFSTYSYLGITKPYIEIPLMNKTKIIKKPTLFFKTNNEITLFKKWMLYFTFNWKSSGENNITYWESSYNLTGGIQTKLLQDRLLISLSVHDILKSVTNAWHDVYQNIASGQVTDPDTRYLKIALKYNFNQFKNIFNKKSSNQQELNRL